VSARRLALPAVAAVLAACAGGAEEREKALAQAKYHYQLAGGYFGEDNHAAAMAELTRALELDPEHAEARHLLGLVHMARREFYEAAEQLRRAVELRPDLLDAKNNLGVAYLALCRWDDAARLYDDLVRQPLYGTPWIAHNNLGWAYWQGGRRADAVEHFRKSVFFNPSFCVAFNNLGMALAEDRPGEEAERALRRALAADPSCEQTYAEPHLHLARLHERQGRAADACAELAACLRKAPPGEEQVGAGCGQAPIGARCEQRKRELGCTSP
jgi:Tfp pilus assembly protein PilF